MTSLKKHELHHLVFCTIENVLKADDQHFLNPYSFTDKIISFLVEKNLIEEINAKRMYEIHNMPAPNINDCIAEAPVSEKDKVRIDAQIFGTGYAEVTENGYRHIPFQRVRTVTRKGGE